MSKKPVKEEPKIKEVTIPVSLLVGLIQLAEETPTGNIPFNQVSNLVNGAKQCIQKEIDKAKES